MDFVLIVMKIFDTIYVTSCFLCSGVSTHVQFANM